MKKTKIFLAIVCFLLCASIASAGWYYGRSASGGFSETDSDLDGLWYFENNFNDSSPSGYDLTNAGSVAFDTATPDPKEGTYSADFPGASGDYLHITDASAPLLSPEGSFTCGGWVYFDAIQACGFAVKDNTGNPVYVTGLTGSDYWFIQLFNEDGIGDVIASTTTPSTGTWYHWTARVDLANDTVEFFVDNTALTTGDFSGGSYSYTSDIETTGPAYFELGARYNNSYRLNGRMDEVFFINRAISDADKNTIYNKGFGDGR